MRIMKFMLVTRVLVDTSFKEVPVQLAVMNEIKLQKGSVVGTLCALQHILIRELCARPRTCGPTCPSTCAPICESTAMSFSFVHSTNWRPNRS